MPTKSVLLTLAAISAAPAVSGQLFFQQTNRYVDGLGSCSSQLPVAIRSTPSAAVGAQWCTASACGTPQYAGATYPLTETVCIAGKPYDLNFGKVSSLPSRDYVVKTEWTNSETCEGAPASVVAVVAEDVCYADMDADVPGKIGRYVKASCNGGDPVWHDCDEKTCGLQKCVEFARTGARCQKIGAFASRLLQCVKSGVQGNDTSRVDNTLIDNKVTDITDGGSGGNGSGAGRVGVSVGLGILSAVFVLFTAVL
ncbi:hypothetical protein HK102_001624 [Quaeritorhiza haematococci]|nr:hypothetical protein HK102_001624 [Quaeritorhiza haematococci]